MAHQQDAEAIYQDLALQALRLRLQALVFESSDSQLIDWAGYIFSTLLKR